ncbi:MAG: ABC transporter ATP-binding protein [Gammaproteobacteria bacterium]|nr:ABC transporter ATP-binding protein [Gammaproteobacteria bacterium]
MSKRVLSLERLHVSFFTDAGELAVVRDVSLSVSAGETLALVGESGCGKSVTALATMGLLDHPGRIVAGDITLGDDVISGFSEPQMRKVRGARIGMIFQEPMTSLNPVFTIGRQLAEVLRLHRGHDDRAARLASLALLERVRIPAALERLRQYPHELSGGMKQRIMIAMAIACEPQLLIADEPTTALDVTIQAQILELLDELQKDLGMAVILITHNLGVVAQYAQRVAVMYAGEIVEQAPVTELFADPRHPYTQALLQSLPGTVDPGRQLNVIQGTVPTPREFPAGCRFATRCGEVLSRCASDVPPASRHGGNHVFSCWQRMESTS